MTLWMHRTGTGQASRKPSVDLSKNPCPAIMAGGIGGGNCSQYWFEDDGMNEKVEVVGKSPYRVPTMSEIASLSWNGFKVASTFSGCGGSCLGYRMAGFRVVWANEFIPVAQQSYRANHPDSYLDLRDIRHVKAEDIFSRTGLKEGELDLFDGSPPCQSFSTAGKRNKGWGKGKKYENGVVQCNENLFFEYIRLLRGLKPKVFVAENVSGLVKGKVKGYFLEILRDLKASGYRVEARLLDAQWLGVPQMRQRIIFVGVRNDLDLLPVFPSPLPYRYSVVEAIGGVGLCPKSYSTNRFTEPNEPAATIKAGGQYWVTPPIANVVRDRRGFGKEGPVGDGPSPTIIAGTAGNLWIEHDEGGRYSHGDISSRPAPTVRAGRAGTMYRNAMFVEGANGFDGHAMKSADGPMPTIQAGRAVDDVNGSSSRRKITIAELKRICAFPDDYVLVGSYTEQWARLGNSVPPVMMRHIAESIRDGILRKVPSRME